MPLLNPAPKWTSPLSTHLVLWHGCTNDDATKIRSFGVSAVAGRYAVDFGRGFYTTTVERQARMWAWDRYYSLRKSKRLVSGNGPVVIRFRVERSELANLKTLHFVDGSFDADNFWSLVQHCRQSVNPNPKTGSAGTIEHHHGPVHFAGGDWYDLVSGPVAAFWQQRSAMSDADQFCFHTPEAVDVLNRCKLIGTVDFDVLPV